MPMYSIDPAAPRSGTDGGRAIQSQPGALARAGEPFDAPRSRGHRPMTHRVRTRSRIVTMVLLALLGCPLASTAGAPGSTPWFTEVAGAIPDQTPVYDAFTGSVVAFITPVDISRDGRDDMVIHYWKFANPFGVVTDVPCTNTLVVLIQQTDSTFVDQTTTYIAGPSDLGACSRKSLVADVNADGYQDVVFATNQEDGRNTSIWEHVEAPVAALVSRADGLYAVETFGQPSWYHEVGVGYDAAGKLFVAAAGGTRPSQVFQRAANGAWLDISSGFPATNAMTFLFNNSGTGVVSDQLIQTAFANGNDIGGAYRDGSGIWQTVPDLRIFPYVGTVNLITWDGGTSQGPVIRIGQDYAVHGAYAAACRFTMSPGSPGMTVLKHSAGIIPGGYTGPDQVVPQDDVIPTTGLYGFRLLNGTLQQASLPIAGQQTVRTNSNFYSCRDLNDDGYMDIAVYPYNNKGNPFVYMNTWYGGLRYIGQSQFPFQATDWGMAGTSLLHDFDKDGIADLLTWPGNGYSSQFGGDMTYHYYKGIRVLPMSSRVASKDFNGDARSDILWRNASTGANAIWQSADSGLRQQVTKITNLAWKVVGVGDFDGDGADDMLWRHDGTGANVYWRAANFSAAQRITSVTNLDWKIIGVGDFNGDRRDDVLWRNASTGANAMWRSANSATTQAVKRVSNLAWKVVGIGDFDGDGRDDMLWRNTSTGGNVIWRSGNAATPQSMTRVSNLSWKIAGIGDFNGDGRDDVLWRHASTGANSIWRSANAATPQPVTGVTNLAWRVAGVGDYNDDGKSDILWRNQQTGANVIWQSGSAATPQAVDRVSNTAWTIVH